MTAQDPTVIVYSGSIVDADLLRSLLDGQGIQSYLKDEFVGMVAPYVVGPGGVGAVKVVIAKKDLVRARPIVEDFIREKSRH
jgi:Putative prokaryotic signal transducing protein